VVPSFGTDTRASGTEAAVVIYTRVSSKDNDGDCRSEGATISSRSITTVTAALIATPAKVNTNPWTGLGEPEYLSIAAGSETGTWFGVTNDSEIVSEDGWSYYRQFPGNLFSMTATAITAGVEITLDPTTSFGDWASVTPLNQESPTQWSLMITGEAEFDGEGIGLATVASVNPETGDVTNGDVLEMTGMGGYQTNRIIARFSSESGGNATMYAVTGENTYSSTMWSFVPN
jgi:hypothetical protein